MALITPFKEQVKYNYTNASPLEGYIIEDILDFDLYTKLKNHISSILNKTNKNTFLTHGTVVHHGDLSKKIISHSQSAREQNVIYDLSFTKDWYYQTKDTVKEWSVEYLRNTLSPIFLKYYQIIGNIDPINNELDDYIFYRLHLNYLPTGECLSLHVDTAPYMAKETAVTQHKLRIRSLTFYLYDHEEGYGGEFWSINGFVYKPRQNTALLLLNGNDCYHGVTANMLPYPRLAFTVRMWHKEDLFLPGHPSKCLYDFTKDL